MEKTKKSGGMLLILMCWIVYTCAYFGKYSYSSFFGFDKRTIGSID